MQGRSQEKISEGARIIESAKFSSGGLQFRVRRAPISAQEDAVNAEQGRQNVHSFSLTWSRNPIPLKLRFILVIPDEICLYIYVFQTEARRGSLAGKHKRAANVCITGVFFDPMQGRRHRGAGGSRPPPQL